MQPEIRHYHPDDLAGILYIRNMAMRHGDPVWSIADLRRVLRKRFRITIVLLIDKSVKGFITYELRETKKEYNILYFAVDPQLKQCGYDQALVKHLTKRLRHPVMMFVNEYNVEQQLFLRSMQFRAVLDHEYYLNKSSYKMVYHAGTDK